LQLPREFHEHLCRRLRDKWRLKFCSDQTQSDPGEPTP
jgi:hypothetical protein